MANNQRRMVYVKIWTSEQFGKLSDKAKLLFIGTITLADDDGRLRANPSYLRGQIFPYDENISVTEVLRFRNEIEESGLFIVYSIDKFAYIEHPNWPQYQSIRKDLYKPSTLPFRNELVTNPLQKRDTSKVKLSKVNLSPSAKKIMQLKEPDEVDAIIDLDSELEESIQEKERISKKGYNPKDVNILIQWGIEKIGRKFTRPLKQKRAIADMLAAGWNKEEIYEKWDELENDKFWGEKGIDFSVLASQIDKIKHIKKPNPLLYGNR